MPVKWHSQSDQVGNSEVMPVKWHSQSDQVGNSEYGLRETATNIDTENKSQGKQVTDVSTKCYIIMAVCCYYSRIHKALLITFIATLKISNANFEKSLL
jgi:hypothetical protein